MGRNIFRQEEQIRRSDAYVDNLAATEANFETNPANLEDDLNSIRSQLHNLLKNQAGNWWDDLVTPSALDTGTERGVNDLNTDLHALERKRVLVKALQAANVDIAVAASAAATAVLTGTANITNTETVTIGGKQYFFQSSLTNNDGNVQVGGSLSATLQNLCDAINLTGTPGTQYAALMTKHSLVTCTANDATTLTITAKGGTFGNSIATTETAANASWGGAAMSGGSGGDIVILGSGELPPNTTAAVGAVTTVGTVVATATTFATAGLDEVSGGSAIAPKNFVEVVDATTRDPILSDGRTVYGLLQGESGVTDGATITDTTTTRVQVSFVRINAAGDDLETIDGADLGGSSVNLCFTERKALEDLTEQDFLRGAVTDVPAASTITRQAGYDNQGVTPVDLTTNATLDLEGAGLEWKIRDDLEADLLRILEGSAGGTSEIQLGAAVDVFNVDAVLNDFLNGVKVDTGAAGTTINIGVTANQIDSGGALTVASGAATDLTLLGTQELFLDDGNQAGSTWAQTGGIKLSDATAEWDTFETNFGEVSLLNAINQAASASTVRKVHATCTVAAAADADVSGPANDNNLDTNLGDLSGGSFIDDYDIYYNGQYQRPGANAAANHDVYPGTSLANGQLKFEHKVKVGDEIMIIDRNE